MGYLRGSSWKRIKNWEWSWGAVVIGIGYLAAKYGGKLYQKLESRRHAEEIKAWNAKVNENNELARRRAAKWLAEGRLSQGNVGMLAGLSQISAEPPTAAPLSRAMAKAAGTVESVKSGTWSPSGEAGE